jgi:hypothetical protein
MTARRSAASIAASTSTVLRTVGITPSLCSTALNSISNEDDYHLSDDERGDVRVGLDQANRGQFVADADVQRYRSRADA